GWAPWSRAIGVIVPVFYVATVVVTSIDPGGMGVAAWNGVLQRIALFSGFSLLCLVAWQVSARELVGGPGLADPDDSVHEGGSSAAGSFAPHWQKRCSLASGSAQTSTIARSRAWRCGSYGVPLRRQWERTVISLPARWPMLSPSCRALAGVGSSRGGGVGAFTWLAVPASRPAPGGSTGP